MNYLRIYNHLITTAIFKKRIKLKKNHVDYIYYEKHHIIPECFFINRKRKGPIGWLEGDPDERENLVLLTPEEHYLAHLLLVKIYPNNYGLIHAAILMSTDKSKRRINNKKYGWLRRKITEVSSPLKGIKISQRPKIICPHCQKEGSVTNMKRWHFDNCLINPINANIFRKSSPKKGKKYGKHKNLRTKPNSTKGKILPPRDEEHCKNISKSLKGKSSKKKGKSILSGKNLVSIKTPDGIFVSYRDAARHHNLGKDAVRWRCYSENFPEWKIIDKVN